MPDPPPTLVHCTNGYPLPDESADDVLAALEKHAVAVKASVSPGRPLPIGLYLPAPAAERLVREDGLAAFRERMDTLGLAVATLNGFPFSRFQAAGDPRRVYRPAWDDRRRVEHALHLAAALAALLPAGVRHASLSTLPVGWRHDGVDLDAAAENLREVADRLRVLEEHSGVRVTLDLEPEPGCVLGDAEAAVAFFDRWLPDAADRGYLGVCHDVCHAAAVFEGQAEALGRYRRAGIGVHKVQLASVPEAVFDGMGKPMVDEAVAVLRTLPGDRSLRQTSLRGATASFFDDLDEALAAHPRPGGRWRIHHHLPLTLDGLGPVRTTRNEVHDALADLAAHGESPILETETYTWSALPPALRAPSLAAGLAGELAWARDAVKRAWPR